MVDPRHSVVQTPLQIAVDENDTSMAEVLVRYGAVLEEKQQLSPQMAQVLFFMSVFAFPP